MTFLELVSYRRSVRSYRDDTVPKEVIETCLEAGRLAPSACNAQPWHFAVVEKEALRRSLAEESRLPGTRMNSFVFDAPVVIALLAEQPNITSQIGGFLKGKPFYLMDLGIVAEHICLQAAELDLGSCMIGWFNEKRVARLLGLSPGKRVALLITIGYPADKARPKRRKSLEEIVSWYR
ncbi:MAG: nitroreductase family protein [Spirochaetaceae bacterium]